MIGRPCNEERILKYVDQFPNGFTANDAAIILGLTSAEAGHLLGRLYRDGKLDRTMRKGTKHTRQYMPKANA